MPACPSCNRPVQPEATFCPECGAALNLTSARTRARRPDREPGEAAGDARSPGGGRYVPGARLAGRYRIVGLLGRGGMGVVYRADDLKLGQAVALKFLPPLLEEDPARLDRLLGEVRLARQVSHPNVCRVYDAGEVDGRHFLTMEYVDGENLASLLRRIGRLPREKAVELGRQICAGLHAAHDQGILHRDLKPANIMIDGRGRARITDFGLAALSGEVSPEEIGSGTPAYMAPEQLQGREVTARSDIYALGLVLYELFTGRTAFSATEREESLRLRLESTPSSPSDHVEGFDPAVERVILRCLEAAPERRPRSALEVAAALPGGDPLAAALAAGETPSPEMVAAAGEATPISPARAWTLAGTAVALFILAATLGGHLWLMARLPELKPPEVMIDHARRIISELGYTEPPYAEPSDTAFSYEVHSRPLQEILGSGDEEEVLRRLRDPSAGVVSFWYRQSPQPLRPSWDDGSNISGVVRPWNPFPRTTGEVFVELDPEGRLRGFAAAPRRFLREKDGDVGPDWSRAFALAGLDPAGFTPVEPRYQRYMQLDERAAWVPSTSGAGYRIEAGSSGGRIALYMKVSDEAAERLAAQPGELPGRQPDFIGWTVFLILIVGTVMARANHRRGRADHRTALKVGAIFGGLSLLARVLPAHEMLRVTALAFSLLSGIGATLIYMALEPYARAIWPTMLLSWSRLLGARGVGWRDPAVGRAVLAGVLIGTGFRFIPVASDLLWRALLGAPVSSDTGLLEALRGGRQAMGVLATLVVYGVYESISVTFMLVLARRVLKRSFLAVLGAGLLWLAPDVARMAADGSWSDPMAIARQASFLLPALALIFWTLLRWGFTASIAMNVTSYLGVASNTSDWEAWHAQPAIMGVVLVTLLAAYGAWAATGGRGGLRKATG